MVEGVWAVGVGQDSVGSSVCLKGWDMSLIVYWKTLFFLAISPAVPVTQTTAPGLI